MAGSTGVGTRRPHFEADTSRRVQLTERDLRILAFVKKYRFLTLEHLVHLIDGNPQRLRWRVRALQDAGYLIPIRNPAPRLAHGGSRHKVYGLSSLGAEALAAVGLMPRDRVNWTRRNLDVADPRLGLGVKIVPHTLGLSDIMVAVERRVAASNGAVRLITEQDMLATMAPERTRGSRHPFSWHVELVYPRIFHDDQGNEQLSLEPRRVGVAPDKVFGLEFPERPTGQNRLFYFLEYDRVTEPVALTEAVDFAQFEKSSIFKKNLAYSSTWGQGVHTKRFGLKSFQVLFITESEARVRTMVSAFALMKERVFPAWTDIDTSHMHRIFRFACRASADPSRLLQYDWVDGLGTPKTLSLPEGV